MFKSLSTAIAASFMMLGAAAPAPDAGQFGLDCTGASVDGVKHTTTPIHYRMSIDMASHSFCFLPECSGLYRLGPVTDSQIGLFDHPVASNYLEATVDRASGAYELIMQSSRANIHVTGTCTWTSFTPFPADAKPVYVSPPFPHDKIVGAPPQPLP